MRRKSLVERIPLALFSAVLMGGAVAFFFFAMPMVLLEQGVIASGLPTFIAAAGPPLGPTARTLVAGTFALLTGGTTWTAITLIGWICRPRIRRSREEAEALPCAPSFEAPTRRPIFASSELGPPAVDESTSREEVAMISFVEPEFPIDDVLELIEPIVDDVPAPLAQPAEELPIAVLMARLEAGAERRAAKAGPPAAPAPTPAIQPAAEFDGALRTALAELQRMAAR